MGKVEKELEETYRIAAHFAVDNVASIFGRIGKKCESEIERLMLLAFIRQQLAGADLVFFEPHRHGYALSEFCDSCVKAGDHGETGTAMQAQADMGPYRADFLLIAFDGERQVGAVVECDGHDFHERTKEQAARDRRRDREMLVAGWYVFRFTGSEIWKDADACALQVLEFLGERAFA